MKTFAITVERQISQTYDLEIEAENEDEARERAEDQCSTIAADDWDTVEEEDPEVATIVDLSDDEADDEAEELAFVITRRRAATAFQRPRRQSAADQRRFTSGRSGIGTPDLLTPDFLGLRRRAEPAHPYARRGTLTTPCAGTPCGRSLPVISTALPVSMSNRTGGRPSARIPIHCDDVRCRASARIACNLTPA